MRIGVLGGGPAGLYFSLLMKQADAAVDIRLIERNPPDATFGWGVVFSPDTLTELRDADYESFTRLSEELVRWDAIDIHLGGDIIRSTGQAFSAISRKTLLQILQQRCAELDVRLEFEREIDDLGQLGDCDLIVAADGVNSLVRRRLEPVIRPTLRVHPTRYAWFGTDLVFDAFTFIFRDTPHGLFQVHGYPFSSELSTFIVETTEQTWRAAGMERASEAESLAFCEDLFAPELGSHRLFSNKSEWVNFLTIACESWHHENVVLVGDSAHTAHFSIGSGTKLAVEDAVALVKAFREHPGDREAAFAAYELERQPPVARFQMAARESSSYFEHVARYLDFPPEQFAFNLLTRSGRITRSSLEQRDALIVGTADRWFVDRKSRTEGWKMSTPPRLVPLTLRELTLYNRVALAQASTDGSRRGVPDQSVEARLTAGCERGVGLVVTESVAVSATGRVTTGSAGLYTDRQSRAWQSMLSRAHDRGDAAVALRLGHAGPRGGTRPRGRGTDRPADEAWPLVSASPVPYSSSGHVPKELGAEEMASVIAEFAEAASRAQELGFDLLIVDAGSGYLLGAFLSPLTNLREDEFGGDVGGRLTFPQSVVASVRSVWNGPLGVRFSANDWRAAGTSPDDAVEMASTFAAAGADFVHVAGGQTAFVAYPDYRRQHLIGLSDRVRNEARVTTLVGGNITTFDQIDTVLAAGRADMCLLDPRLYDGSPFVT